MIGDIEAGARTPSRLQPRQAARVQTGAPMPTLADAVLPLRWTDGGESQVRVLRSVRSGAYVRRTGDDVQPGDVAVRAGTIIGAAQVGLLAAVGRERVLVHPRPRLSVMCVGGELVDISRDAGQRAGVRREFVRAGRGRPRCRRRGQPRRHRRHRPQGAARRRRGTAEPRRGGGHRGRGRRSGRRDACGRCCRRSARWTSPASRCTPARCRVSGSSAARACRCFCCRPIR